MSDDRAKTPRTLLISDLLWETFAAMAEEMGSDRDALINQALHMFARLNGYLVPADLARLGMVPRAALTDSGRLRIAPAPEPTTLDADEREVPPAARAQPVAQLSQQLAAGGTRRPPPSAEDSSATTMDLSGVAMLSSPRVAIAGAAPAPGASLVLIGEDGSELERVGKDRFLIGRGKHCDLVINSGKVSREHAAIVREGDAWFIEDLGSSNGTWFDARRITRRQIQEGDEYFVCSEKLRCSFR
ncbi:MAG TPA: FHA domain-containing protein [Myxococcales bacterium]|nr:FHA domain-containing protein [Myxococcales bacterium]